MSDSESTLKYSRQARHHRWWVAWVYAFGSGLTGGLVGVVSGHGITYLAPVVIGLFVGVTCALVSKSHPFFFGLLGVGITMSTVLAISLWQHALSAWFVVVAVVIIFGVPGAAGAGLIAIWRRRSQARFASANR